MKETLQQALEALRDLENRQHALSHAMGMLSLDAATVGPKGAGEGRGQTLGVLSDMYYALIADLKNEAILSALEAGADELDPQAQAGNRTGAPAVPPDFPDSSGGICGLHPASEPGSGGMGKGQERKRLPRLCPVSGEKLVE